MSAESKPTEAETDLPFPPAGASGEFTVAIDNATLNYRAECDWLTLRRIHKPVAHIFHTAYLLQTNDEAAKRPLTFVFNGGPGAASAYLHMGAVGPKRVAFGPQGSLPQPPTNVVDNHETWLPFTDLVFIDPVGTGFSRALNDKPQDGKSGEAKPKDAPSGENPADENPEFWDVEKDLESLGEFISRFLSRQNRWTSPVFIAGESYGGFRVARMARHVQEQHGVGLSGAMLISPAIEFDSLIGTDYNMTYWVEHFPSFAAAAFQNGIATDANSLEDCIQQAETFARNELASLVVHGDALPKSERDEILSRMSALSGLSGDFLARAGGRVTATMFCRELHREQRRLCGHYDASVTTVDPFPDRENYEGPDPTLFSIDRLFTSGINHHLRTTLNVDTELDYRLLSMQVNKAWKDADSQRMFRRLAGAMDDLRYGMSLNEHMKVNITHGYFDLITPYFSSRRLVDLMKLTDAQRANISTANYKGGHMFYSWDESRIAFTQDTSEFYASAM